MGMPAARKGDKIACPLPNPPIAPPKPPTFPIHAPPPGNEISVIADNHKVEIGGAVAARMGDFSKCHSPETPKVLPNPILQGSIPVMIGNKPAARSMDSATHPGSVIASPCCKTVLIGLAGCGGNPWAGEDDCKAAAAGRKSGKEQQSFGNCGVESARQIINRATGAGVNETEALTQAINAGTAAGSVSAAGAIAAGSGGASMAGIVRILGSYGVAAVQQATSMANIGAAALAGQGAIVPVNSQALWKAAAPGGGDHGVTVTGVKYDANGDIEAVFINDTGTGKCKQEVPIADFILAMDTNMKSVITANPIF